MLKDQLMKSHALLSCCRHCVTSDFVPLLSSTSCMKSRMTFLNNTVNWRNRRKFNVYVQCWYFRHVVVAELNRIKQFYATHKLIVPCFALDLLTQRVGCTMNFLSLFLLTVACTTFSWFISIQAVMLFSHVILVPIKSLELLRSVQRVLRLPTYGAHQSP